MWIVRRERWERMDVCSDGGRREYRVGLRGVVCEDVEVIFKYFIILKIVKCLCG